MDHECMCVSAGQRAAWVSFLRHCPPVCETESLSDLEFYMKARWASQQGLAVTLCAALGLLCAARASSWTWVPLVDLSSHTCKASSLPIELLPWPNIWAFCLCSIQWFWLEKRDYDEVSLLARKWPRVLQHLSILLDGHKKELCTRTWSSSGSETW